MSKNLTVHLKNEITEISRMMDIVEEFGSENNISPAVVNSLNLSLDELVTNTISYAFEDSEPHTIILTLTAEEGSVSARIEDDGRAFNPLEVPEADITKPLEEKSIGGLGLHLVKNLMDSVAYRRIADKNVFIMNKNL